MMPPINSFWNKISPTGIVWSKVPFSYLSFQKLSEDQENNINFVDSWDYHRYYLKITAQTYDMYIKRKGGSVHLENVQTKPNKTVT